MHLAQVGRVRGGPQVPAAHTHISMSHPHLRPLGDSHDATPPRALFIQRWRTLFTPPASSRRAWCASFSGVNFAPGALQALFRAGQRGWTIYLLGNEDAVAGGQWSERSWEKFERQLLGHLAQEGIKVQRNYACLDRPGGAGSHDKDSVFRLPGTGVFYHAAQQDGIDLSSSWVIASDPLELAAGWRAGCRLAAVSHGEAPADGTYRKDNLCVRPEHILPELSAALELASRSAAVSHRHPA